MKYFLGIDIGTTNVKFALFDEKWYAVLVEEAAIKTLLPKHGYCEQDPQEILRLSSLMLKKVLSQADANGFPIIGMGLSTAMHSFMAVDENSSPLTNLIVWSDIRSIQISDSLKENSTIKKYFEKSNVPMHPMLPLTKWLWINQYSGKKRAIHKAISFKEYLINKWFGDWIVDESVASSTGYYDINKNDWNIELLQYLKLDIKQLPEIKPTTYILKNWKKGILKETGKDNLPPLVLGSSDGCLANMAAGVLDKTKASLTIGTSGAVRTAFSNPFNQGQRLFCYPLLKDYYVVGGAVNNGGNAVEWFKSNLAANVDNFWEEFDDFLSTIRPGAEGMFFLPYLYGERAPLWDPSLRGAYIGISNTHTNRHFLRATIEGVVFALKHLFKLIDERPNTIKTVIADGGFTRSKVWVQLVSDMLGVEVLCPDQSYGAAKGAAMLSMIAIEDTILELLIYEQEIEGEMFKPRKANKELYERLFINYLNASSLINQWKN